MSDRVAVFNDGMVQQVDDPRAIYEAPQNSFVANFIGENNNLDGRIAELADGEAVVTLESGETVRARASAFCRAGGRTSLSVRPERLHLGAAGRALDNRLSVAVAEIIYGGDHSMLRLSRAGGPDLLAKVVAAEAEGVQLGERLEIGWRAAHCRALDPV
jgi:putative spermidine/putrescine transport system ATP-binding protein